jgi:putative ABC transport system permease protein
MIKFFPIAFRGVFRNTRRTALTLLGISAGVVALVLAGGFFAYNFQGLRETSIRNGLGHIQIFTGRYLDEGEERPLANGIADYRELQTWLEAQPNVKATTGQVDFVGLISNGEKSEAFLGSGVDPDREAAMGFVLNLKQGEPLSSGDDGVLLATGLAKALRAQVGDVLTLMATTADGALNGIDVKVAGIFSTGVKEFDARALRVRLATAQRLLATDRVTKVIVTLEASKDTQPVKAALEASRLGPASPLRMRTWRDLATFYRQTVQLFSAIFVFLGLIITVLVLLSTSNTMMMSAFERVKEIGTLMAFGTRRRQVLGIFVLEGLVIGVLGAGLGLAAGYGLIRLINVSGIMMPPPPTFDRGFPLRVHFVPELFVGVFVVTVVVLVCAAILPAWRGARLRIVDALGHI